MIWKKKINERRIKEGLSLPLFPTVLSAPQTTFWHTYWCIVGKNRNYSRPFSAFLDINSTDERQWPVPGSRSVEIKSRLEYHMCSGSGQPRRPAALAHLHLSWKPHYLIYCRRRVGACRIILLCLQVKGYLPFTPPAHSSPSPPVWDPFTGVHFWACPGGQCCRERPKSALQQLLPPVPGPPQMPAFHLQWASELTTKAGHAERTDHRQKLHCG